MHKPSACGGGKGRDPGEISPSDYFGRPATNPLAREEFWKPERIASDRAYWDKRREIAESIVLVANGDGDERAISLLEKYAVFLADVFPEGKDQPISEWAKLVVKKAINSRPKV
jgi:hypothetical protein